ncbi:submandibular gland secretory Glx-rich protein CA-like [Uranotaenia lowii]|uniref:submandibular gland secretory Glx-rich protein CA-like n=1 Tax=Uranotaenia lowii TaxID=190385 RepID=UPI002478D32B|nr:submandibular gland secretory Glx-rich protein CA-like [Uranotaenia lowii]
MLFGLTDSGVVPSLCKLAVVLALVALAHGIPNRPKGRYQGQLMAKPSPVMPEESPEEVYPIVPVDSEVAEVVEESEVVAPVEDPAEAPASSYLEPSAEVKEVSSYESKDESANDSGADLYRVEKKVKDVEQSESGNVEEAELAEESEDETEAPAADEEEQQDQEVGEVDQAEPEIDSEAEVEPKPRIAGFEIPEAAADSSAADDVVELEKVLDNQDEQIVPLEKEDENEELAVISPAEEASKAEKMLELVIDQLKLIKSSLSALQSFYMKSVE